MPEEHKLTMICRGVYGDILLKAMEALYKGSIRLAEVTFDQKSRGYRETLDATTMPEKHFRGRTAIGAGTVVSSAQVESTYQVKAAHIIPPNVNEAVIHKIKELGMLFIPGALSLSEALDAYEYGVDYVKLFPTARMTASYIKGLTGPISHVKSIAIAGITEENIAEFAAIGCTDYSIGRRSVDKRATQKGRFEELQHRTEAFIVCLQKEEK